MAKINVYSNYTSGFSNGAELSINDSKTRATLEYGEGGEIKIFGEGLKEGPASGFKAGTIDKLVLVNGLGEKTVVFEGSYNASKVASNADIEAIYYSLFDGKDIITGSSADDTLLSGRKGDDKISGKGGIDQISGGRGDDILTGGADQDYFQFASEDGVGNDIITDFDTMGMDADSLGFYEITIEKVSKTGGGDDCKLVMDNGSTIVLEDVTKAEFQDYWASLP